MVSAGDFPEIWADNIIIPVKKRGTVDDPGNYRGISLVSRVGKLFTSIINTGLTKWSEKHNIVYRFYCCFIDFKSSIRYLFLFQIVSQIWYLWKLINCY